jgi:hypothetical protein
MNNNYQLEKEAGFIRTKIFGPFRLASAILKRKANASFARAEAESTKNYLKNEFGVTPDKIKYNPGGTFEGFLKNKVLLKTEEANKYKRAAQRLERLKKPKIPPKTFEQLSKNYSYA